jgi:hypothetical protein
MSDASRWQPKPIYRCPVCGVHSTAPGRCRCTPKRRPGRVLVPVRDHLRRRPRQRVPGCGVTGRNEWSRTTKPEPGTPLHSPTDRAVTAEQARRPLQTSKKEEK